MSAIKFNAALTQRVHCVEIPQQVGSPVVLRLNGMALGAAKIPAQVSAPPRVGSAMQAATKPPSIKTPAPPPHTVRLGAAATMEAPWSMRAITAAVQELPGALRLAAFQGAAMIGTRLAPFVLPTVALSAALYPRSIGFSSLPVPPRSDHAEGFKLLDAHDPVQAGVPHTEYTRPRTERKRELPITATTEPELHPGGQPVTLPTTPGKSVHTDRPSDHIHLAQQANTETSAPPRAKLTFSEVQIQSQRIPLGLNIEPDKTLRLNFEAGEYGKGTISIRWEGSAFREYVHAEVEKNAQLPDRFMGEILAHALGYEIGFIPRGVLSLRVTDIEHKTPASGDSVRTITRWALGMHGHKATSDDVLVRSDEPFVVNVSPSFRTTSYSFENPTVISGDQGNGPGLATPRIFPNLSPSLRDSTAPAAASARDWRPIASPDEYLNARVNHTPKNYVIPMPTAEAGLIEARVGGRQNGHPHLAQGRPVLGAGDAKPAYDPDGEPGHRIQWLTDTSGHYQPFGTHTKKATERAFQDAGLDGDLRWFPTFGKPVSTEPFAGLMVQKKTISAQRTVYEIRVPDARALATKGPTQALDKKSRQFPDLASVVLEPVQGRPGWVRIRDIKVIEEMDAFTPTFIGQALAAVQLEQPFKGLVVNASEWMDSPSLRETNFSDGVTIYGLDKQLGEFSPELPFISKRSVNVGHANARDVEFFINPAVQIQR